MLISKSHHEESVFFDVEITLDNPESYPRLKERLIQRFEKPQNREKFHYLDLRGPDDVCIQLISPYP